MELLSGVFLLLGGIGLFLYGINFMSNGLEQAAGDNLRSVLERMTRTGPIAVLVGIAVTAMIQSSGATSVMVVGFVNAGIMNLSQALYVMLGANIGTTITAQIIAFRIEVIAPLILFVGMLCYMFIKNRTVKKVGAVILGFGILFVGIYIMGEAVDSLNLSVVIKAFLDRFSNPLISLLFGVLITAVIQSSSASIGILQVLVSQSASANIGLSSVFFLVLGMNIGAVSPVVIASIGASKSARRTAAASVIAKVFGTLIFSLLYLLIPGLVSTIENLSPGDVGRQIANLHLGFNLVSTVAIFPFVGLIVKLLDRIFPDDPADEATSQKLIYLNSEIMLTPAIAVTQAKRELIRMLTLARDNMQLAVDSFFSDDYESAARVFEVEKTINFLNHAITGYLVVLNGKALPQSTLERVGEMFHVAADIERIGDHAENIAEYTQKNVDNPIAMSEAAYSELRKMCADTVQCIDYALDIYANDRFNMLDTISKIENDIDDEQTLFTEHHIERLKNGDCSPRGGVIFTDMVTDLERCSDHAINIAYAINGPRSQVQVKKYIVARGENID